MDFDKYRVEGKLPHAWMADVYKAVDRATGVTVKIHHFFVPPVSRDGEPALRLRHPGIEFTLHSGVIDNRLFLVTEWLDGAPLQLTPGAPLEPGRALDYLNQLAAALDYAHQMGVPHLALEPERIVVDGAGKVWLTGFGHAAMMAKTYGEMPELMMPPVLCFAPEMANHPGDAQSDQFLLAVLAYQMFTGQPPFHHEEAARALYLMMRGERPLAHQVNPALSAGLSAVLQRGMAVEPGQRFGSCGELVMYLARPQLLLPRES